MKKDRMKRNILYYLCPDKRCKKFLDKTFRPCEYDCPHKGTRNRFIKCICGNIVELRHDTSIIFQRATCGACGSEYILCHFTCFQRIFEVKE